MTRKLSKLHLCPLLYFYMFIAYSGFKCMRLFPAIHTPKHKRRKYSYISVTTEENQFHIYRADFDLERLVHALPKYDIIAYVGRV